MSNLGNRMSGIQIADAKAPFVRFEVRAEEDRAESVKAGRYVTKDVVYAVITPHGSKDEIDRVAEEWLNSMDKQAREKRLPMDWAKAYRHAYNEFLEGRTIPLEGTPIANWPMVSPSQVKNLQSLHILTVEVLAGANEQVIARLGMGGRDLVKRAQEYLKQAEGPGKAAAQITSLEQRVEDLSNMVRNLEQQNELLRSQVQAANTPQHADPQAGNNAGGLLDDDEPTGLRKL